jgi:hypothetical protein
MYVYVNCAIKFSIRISTYGRSTFRKERTNDVHGSKSLGYNIRILCSSKKAQKCYTNNVSSCAKETLLYKVKLLHGIFMIV